MIRKQMANPTIRASLAFGGMGTVGLGFASWHFFPNTIFIDRFKEFVHLYRHGAQVPVPQDVTVLFETTMKEVKIRPNHQALIQPFTVYGFDMFHAGSTASRFGARIGIPSNFYYKDVKDVETHLITIQNRSVEWSSDAGRNFKESLVYSGNAKAYLLAREILMVDSSLVFLRSVYPMCASLFVYTVAYTLNRKLKLFQRPFLLRGIMYGLVGLFGLGSWAFLQDFTTCFYELKADQKLCATSRKYVEGGFEAYSKILQRNISLRELMGAKGPKTYTATGNNVTFFRQKHLPLTSCEKFFAKQLKESEARSETDSQALPNNIL